MRQGLRLPLILTAVTLGLAGCGEPTSSPATREAVAAGLLAAGGGGLSADQIQTFPTEIQGAWAVVYDPASPPGCVPGGLKGTPGPEIPRNPCRAWLLRREKVVWRLVAQGPPGTFEVPAEAPAALGDPGKLEFLAR